MSDRPPILIRNLWHSYGGRKPTVAVRGLDLDVKFGEVVALLGTNGAGKSTAIKSLLGQITPTSGRVELLGHDASLLPPEVRRRVGYMAEGNRLDPWASISELVAFTASFYPDWNAGECTRLLEHLDLSLDRKVKSLSNGERGRLALVLSFAPDPDVLILDDPMLGIDPVVRHEFFETMAEVLSREDGRKRAILFTSHVLPDVERVADRVVIMVKGVVVAHGTIEGIRAKLKRVQVRFSDEREFPAGVAGVLSSRRDGRAWKVVTTEPDALRSLDAESVDDDEMSFEEIFVTLAAPNRKSKLFPIENEASRGEGR